jgi:hypothetical protein
MDGQHWVYRLDGRRKCWFLTAAGIATVRKPVRHHAAEHRVAPPAENETVRLKQEAVANARAELLRSPPAEKSQPRPPASELKLVDVASVVPTGAVVLAPPTPVANRAGYRLTLDYPTPRPVDVEAILVTASAASDAFAASVPPAPPVALPIAEADDEELSWTANWLGLLLMALGLVSVLSSSRLLRGAALLRQLKWSRFAKGS